jgi:hypothetical protein
LSLVAEFRWDLAKDARLQRERGIGFEAISKLIDAGHLWRVRQNPRHPGQVRYDVEVDGYIYTVAALPEAGETVRLITIYPNGQATRVYRKARER